MFNVRTRQKCSGVVRVAVQVPRVSVVLLIVTKLQQANIANARQPFCLLKPALHRLLVDLYNSN